MEELKTPEGGILIPVPIETEMKRAYIDYSMSVIVSRALPDVRDGLKPVHRRILYSMEERSLRYSGPTRKCAKIVGDVLGSYHPHGDASVYDALVRLGQDFSLRYPVIHPQGNFGTIGGDPAAAYRYTEAKMAKIAETMVEDIKKETVDFIPNFDESTVEPTVLPAKFPFLLANGSSGIAVGMATNMPPHNLREIAAAVAAYIDNPEITIDELTKFMAGPDFPTGGVIYGRKGIKQAFKTGKGRVIVRGRFTIEVDKKGRESIVFTEVPYQVNTTVLCERIGALAREKVIDGIAAINDESSDRAGLRIVIELKRGAIAKVVLNQLFSKTALQSSFSVNNLALVKGRPEVLTLKSLIHYFVEHRNEVVTRRIRFDLRKAEERAHILRALIVAIDNIDEVIKIIRSSRDTQTAKNGLMERFSFDEVQAQAIVDMQLKRLTSLEIETLKKELEELEIFIEKCKDLLAHPEKILQLVKTETLELAEKFGDDRKTTIVADEVEEINIEDLIKEEDMVILISRLGYIKSVPVTAYKNQGKGGKGSNSAKLVEDDYIKQLFVASTHDYIVFISTEGKAYWIKVHEIPEAGRASRGAHIKSLLSIGANEEIATVVSLREFSEEHHLFMATANGVIKKVKTADFKNAKTRGIIAINLDAGDKIVSAILTGGSDDLALASRRGKVLRITETSVRPMGRSSRGVSGLKLAVGDELTAAVRVDTNANMLLITESGYGKRVDFDQFSVHSRGTQGQIGYNVTDKTGEVVGVIAAADSDEVMCITSQGKTLKLEASAISRQGRTSQGVCILKIDAPDFVIGVDRVEKDEE
ncbi:DNA topoisomerase (ATP-hydrolyzing) subunit A [Treponema sp. OMZ 840]|uniref:DNA topoisomerase (ATP-hydrolyzing) subunit A n=1 Tax=Treponema sp. OMZ 840 TaxID=244313 RepID=UPI003D8D8043